MADKSASGNGNSRNGAPATGSSELVAGRLALRSAPARAGARRMAERPIEFKARKPVYVAAKAVGTFVPGLTRKSFEKFGFATAQLITDWGDVAGVELARFTCPERIRWPRLPLGEDGEAARGGAVLMLRVDPARALDVEYKRAQLMERINVYFGYRAVADIRIVQGAIDRAEQNGKAFATPPLSVGRPARPAAGGKPAGAPEIEAVADEGLRQALARLQSGIQSRQAKV